MFGQYVDVPGLALDLWVKAPSAGQDVAEMFSCAAGLAYGF